MRWLALDVGSKRVGLAVSDDAESIVTPLSPLRFRGPQELAGEVARIVTERGIGGIVVGVPRTRSGAGRGERRVAAVVEALSILSVPVVTVDERGTTLEAKALLRSAGVPPHRWDGVVDGVAARLILEFHLDQRHGRRCNPG